VTGEIVRFSIIVLEVATDTTEVSPGFYLAVRLFFTEFTEFTDASMPPDNAGMSTHSLSPYKAYYLY